MFTKPRSQWLVLTAALGFGLAACSDSTGPTGPFEPTEDALAVSTVEDDLEGNPALASLSLIVGVPGTAFAFSPLDLSRAATDPSATEELRTSLSSLATGSPFALSEVIPPELRGRTYVYDPDSVRYVHDPTRTGAPANGVRFILYAVDPITFEPVFPLVEIGRVDLIDTSTLTTDRVRVLAVIDGVTYIDYTLSGSGTVNVFIVDIVGYVTDGTHRVNFDMRAEIDFANGHDAIDIVLDAVTRGVRLHLSFDEMYDPSTSEFEQAIFTYEIRTPRGTVRFSVTITPTTVSGDIRHNGRVVVTITGTEGSVSFTRADDGEPLTTEELAALEDLFDGPDVLLFLLSFLFAPLFVPGA